MEGPVGPIVGNSVISSIRQAQLFGRAAGDHSAPSSGIPIRRLFDGTGMDLKVLKVIFGLGG